MEYDREYDRSSMHLLRPALAFVPNRGQAARPARFTARALLQNFYFHEDGVTVVLLSPEKRAYEQQGTIKGAVVKLAFLGASPVDLQALHPAGQFHSFTGNDTADRRTQLPAYEQLLYTGLYDGVDLTLSGTKEGLQFLWTLKYPSRVGTICVRYEGAEEIRIAEDGSLVIRHAVGALIVSAPVAWQNISEKKKRVLCAYALDDTTVSFTLSGAHDAEAPLYINSMML